jgi:hypothetical protein
MDGLMIHLFVRSRRVRVSIDRSIDRSQPASQLPREPTRRREVQNRNERAIFAYVIAIATATLLSKNQKSGSERLDYIASHRIVSAFAVRNLSHGTEESMGD